MSWRKQSWSKNHTPRAAQGAVLSIYSTQRSRRDSHSLVTLHTSKVLGVCTLTSRPTVPGKPIRGSELCSCRKAAPPTIYPTRPLCWGRPASHRQTLQPPRLFFPPHLICIILASKINFPQTSGAPSGQDPSVRAPFSPCPHFSPGRATKPSLAPRLPLALI